MLIDYSLHPTQPKRDVAQIAGGRDLDRCLVGRVSGVPCMLIDYSLYTTQTNLNVHSITDFMRHVT
jgi:hypothetical protein